MYIGVSVKPGLWTLDWTHGLDCGLRFGLDFGLMLSSMTIISKRLQIDSKKHCLIEGTSYNCNCQLVTRSWPGGYTCKHLEVEVNISL